MSREEIWTRLTTIFKEVLDLNDINLEPRTTADDIREWDSVTHIQLLVAAESEFGVRFQTGEVAALANVGQLVDLIEKRIVKSSDEQ